MTQQPTATQSSPMSLTSLILGIASIFFGSTIILPIVGIVLGVMGKKREPAGTTMANWGIGLSIAMLVIGALLWIFAGGLILAAIGIAGVAATGS